MRLLTVHRGAGIGITRLVVPLVTPLVANGVAQPHLAGAMTDTAAPLPGVR